MSKGDSDYFGTWDECPNCGAVFGGEEYINQHCHACGWQPGDNLDPDDNDDYEPTGVGYTEPPYADEDPAAKLCKYCRHTLDDCICEYVDD